MAQDTRPVKVVEAKGVGRAAERRENAARELRSDWDNPFGDEPAVPIIYEPY
jgi:hypothetical protein